MLYIHVSLKFLASLHYQNGWTAALKFRTSVSHNRLPIVWPFCVCVCMCAKSPLAQFCWLFLCLPSLSFLSPQNLPLRPLLPSPAGKVCPGLVNSSTASLAPGWRQRFRGLPPPWNLLPPPGGDTRWWGPLFSGSVFAVAADAAASNTAAQQIFEVVTWKAKRSAEACKALSNLSL